MGDRGLKAIVTEFGRLGTPRELAAGDVLWREGEAGKEVALLVEGLLEVVHEEAEGQEVLFRVLEPGAVAGEISSTDGRARSATVRARTPCRIVRVAATEFRRVLRERPDLLEEMYWLQVERVRSLTRLVTRAHRRAITDPLTGLYNFGFFRDRLVLEVERARESSDPVSLAMFDVDHFKRFNDAHGHPAGNRVLVAVAETLRRCARRGDVIARYGGEELVALFYAAPRDHAARYAEEVRESVEGQGFAGADGSPAEVVTVSAGVAAFPEDADGDEALVAAADRRLYLAKQRGRNRVVSRDEP